MGLCIMFDFGSEEPLTVPIKSTMALELTTILLGLCVAAVAVLYAAPRGYMGHKRLKASTATTSIQTYTQPAPVEEAKPAPAPEPVQSVPPPAPAPAPTPAIYESVQPAPAPAVTYSAPSSTSFGAPTISRKPTRTYRRRTAPVRSTSSARSTKTKPRKREAR